MGFLDKLKSGAEKTGFAVGYGLRKTGQAVKNAYGQRYGAAGREARTKEYQARAKELEARARFEKGKSRLARAREGESRPMAGFQRSILGGPESKAKKATGSYDFLTGGTPKGYDYLTGGNKATSKNPYGFIYGKGKR